MKSENEWLTLDTLSFPFSWTRSSIFFSTCFVYFLQMQNSLLMSWSPLTLTLVHSAEVMCGLRRRRREWKYSNWNVWNTIQRHNNGCNSMASEANKVMNCYDHQICWRVKYSLLVISLLLGLHCLQIFFTFTLSKPQLPVLHFFSSCFQFFFLSAFGCPWSGTQFYSLFVKLLLIICLWLALRTSYSNNNNK